MYTIVVCGGGEEVYMSILAKVTLVMLVTAFVFGFLAHDQIRTGIVEKGLALIMVSLLFIFLGGVMQIFTVWDSRS